MVNLLLNPLAQHCPQPLDPPENGTIVVQSSGTYFGHLCRGHDFTWESVNHAGCQGLEIAKKASVGQDQVATYMLRFYTLIDPPQALLMLLQFSQALQFNEINFTRGKKFATTSANGIMLEVPMESLALQGGVNHFEMSIAIANASDLEPCLLESVCSTCPLNQCDGPRAQLEADLYLHQTLTAFDTTLEYKCGPGQEFLVHSETQESIVKQCQWNQTWDGPDSFNCVCELS
eukprot:maker-scaffold1823_size43701-snap-gene-0.6 protein:Tk12650 transcript:maker-scaffold1823_size43701-snap-gene-0.6-mRNA-1 annotation:"hypothetical protein"